MTLEEHLATRGQALARQPFASDGKGTRELARPVSPPGAAEPGDTPSFGQVIRD